MSLFIHKYKLKWKKKREFKFNSNDLIKEDNYFFEKKKKKGKSNKIYIIFTPLIQREEFLKWIFNFFKKVII